MTISSVLLLATSMATSAVLTCAALWIYAGGWRKGKVADPEAARLGLTDFVRSYRGCLLSASALIVVQTVLDLAAPWPLKIAVDNIIGGKPLVGWMAGLNGFSTSGLAALVAFAGIALVAASGIVGYFATYLVGSASERAGADIRCAAFARLQHRSLRFHDAHRSGDLAARLTSDVARLQDLLVSWFQTLVPDLLAVGGMLIVLGFLDLQMALAALAVIPLLAVQILVSRNRIKKTEREVRDRFGHLVARATEVLRHVRAVKAFFRHDDEERRFRGESSAATRAALAALKLRSRYAPASDLILALGSGFILFLGILRVVGDDMTVGTLLVVLAYLASFYHPVSSLARWASHLARSEASRERLAEIFADDRDVPEDPQALPASTSCQPLTLHDVTFAYRHDRPVLKNLSCTMRPKESVCIVGASGAGKSTLLSLLLRLYDPDKGSIALGGIDLRRYQLRSLRSQIALVPQDTWIFDGTVADNIRFGRPEATDAEIRSFGSMALLDDFVASLPEGYDARVGEGGTGLSGGQRRRLALARALIRDASTFLLDEPTSGLDADAEAIVIEAIKKIARDRTVIMASHSMKLAAIADRVLVLESGQIVEEGRPAALLAAGGAFARLCAAQALRLPDGNRYGSLYASLCQELPATKGVSAGFEVANP